MAIKIKTRMTFSAFSEPQLLSTEAHGRIVDQYSFIGDEMTIFWTRFTHFFEIRLAGAPHWATIRQR
jgi:hypothetical protein